MKVAAWCISMVVTANDWDGTMYQAQFSIEPSGLYASET